MALQTQLVGCAELGGAPVMERNVGRNGGVHIRFEAENAT